jgi:hypothetical protein
MEAAQVVDEEEIACIQFELDCSGRVAKHLHQHCPRFEVGLQRVAIV